MFIQTQETSDPNQMKFLPGCTVLPAGQAVFANGDAAVSSPLVQRLFGVAEVSGVELGTDFIIVTKVEAADWRLLKAAVLGAVMEHFMSGTPVMEEETASADDAAPGQADDAVAAEIRELIETRIRPAAAQSGGDVVFHGLKDDYVLLDMQGPALQLKAGIENMLRHYVPEVRGVKDYRDALPKPGLETPEATAIQELLDNDINPTVASHGGHIALIDVQGDTAYIRLEGGCQGCGMADVTLKQGVEVQIKQHVPQIRQVLDVTDHASGHNPYHQG